MDRAVFTARRPENPITEVCFMANGIVRVPEPVNEPVRWYAPGSAEKESLKNVPVLMVKFI